MPFLDRSKKDTPKNGPSPPPNASISNGEESFASSEATTTVEVHLPQPVEDSTILKELITLRSHIEAHTTSFYRKDHVAVSGAELKAHLGEHILKNTTENDNGNATALASILMEARSRTTGIRIVIARILFATIDFFGDPQQTLLSPAAVSLMAAFRSKEHPGESQEVYELALARWRILASFLLPTAHARSRLEVSDTRVRDLIDKLNSILMPFIEEQYASGKGREDRENNLAMMISRILRLGTMLFAQPTTWNLSWEIPMDVQSDKQRQDPRWGASRQKGLVVYPAIWKTGDIDGRMLPKAMLKEDAEVDSSPITISRMSMYMRQDDSQPYAHSLLKKEVPRLEKRAPSHSAGAEQSYEQKLYDSSQNRKNFVEPKYDPYGPNGQGRLHGLPQESTDFHPSYRDITGSIQKVVLSSSAAEGSYQESVSDEIVLRGNDIARLEQKVVTDSMPAETLHEPQDLKKASSTRREDAESQGKIVSHPVISRRPYVQLQQQNSPAKERIIEPEPSLSKTDIGEHSTVPVSRTIPKFDSRKSSDGDPQLEGDGPSDADSCSGKDPPRREPKPDYNRPTPTPSYEQTFMDHPRSTVQPTKLPTRAEQYTRVQAPPQEKSSTSISGPRPQSPTKPAQVEHGSNARITSQAPNLAQEQDYRPESPKRKIKRKYGIVSRTKSQSIKSRDGGGPKVESQWTEAKAQYDIVSNAQYREPTREHDQSPRQPSPDTQYSQQHAADDPSPVFRHDFSKHQGRKIRKSEKSASILQNFRRRAGGVG